ncbi:uncharacterized protein LOC142163888 [Nicotiana tabacum]|uniref:Uncharacterized protein LOC142163888 n=1 Tax=Nicotiana tabacum TaxID=4097 RepID=A0AC58RWP9_TOBAC
MDQKIETGTLYEWVAEIAQRIEGIHQKSREQALRDRRPRYYGGLSGAPSRGRVGDSVVVDQINRSCIVTFCGYETRVDLLLLDMTDFEVILGMDWLSLYHAVLDCHAKTVTLAMLELPILDWRCSSISTSSQVFSFLKARHMVEKGCLAYIRDTAAETPMIDFVIVVQEFSDLFPSDLPGMPPDRDINFCLDLVVGTQLIYIPPYRMAPKELKELKKQIEELLAKGFVRSSVLSRGAPVLFVKIKDGTMQICIHYH